LVKKRREGEEALPRRHGEHGGGMEEWKSGMMEEWKIVKIRQFDNENDGRMEEWNPDSYQGKK